MKIKNKRQRIKFNGILPPFSKYKKRPIVIEAVQLHSDFEVETLEGIMKGKPGDYLIQGIEEEWYPCDKDIFEGTYDAVMEGNNED